MKTSILKTLFIAGLALSPSLLLAQSATPTVPATPTPGASGTSTAQPGAAQSGTTATDAASANRDADAKTNADAKRNSDANANRDNDISQSAREQFGKLDANSNGKLNLEEFSKYSQPMPNPARDASSSTAIGRNGTGPGTPGSTTGSTGGITGAANDADRDPRTDMSAQDRFRQLDLDSDGELTIQEFNRANPTNPDAGRDASSSTGVGRSGTGPGTPGSTTGSTEGSTANPGGKADEKR